MTTNFLFGIQVVYNLCMLSRNIWQLLRPLLGHLIILDYLQVEEELLIDVLGFGIH